MLTRMSSLFLRTLRENPADVDAPGDRLLIRAGYLRRTAPGAVTWLPLGLGLLRTVERIVREELAAIGAQEIRLPEFPGDAGFVHTVRSEYGSYKDFPVTLWQFGAAGREFLAESCSFDLGEGGSYRAHRDACGRILDRLGLDRLIAEAAPGGGAEAFLAESPTGPDVFFRTTGSGYAATPAAVVTPAPPARSTSDTPAAGRHHTPGTPTIAGLVEHLNTKADLGRTFTAADTLKNVLCKVREPGAAEWTLLAIGLPGDREVDLDRARAALHPAEVALLDDADFAANPFLVKGYIGPVALAAHGVRYLADPRVVPGTAWVTGADEPDHHVVDLVCGRDFTPDGTIEAAEVRAGDPAPDGTGPLVHARGTELARLSRRSTSTVDRIGAGPTAGGRTADGPAAGGLTALGPDGRPVPVAVGSYRIGVSRLVAAIAARHHDEHGLAWPRPLAPADVHVVAAGKGEAVRDGAEDLAAELAGAGVRVLLDDRAASTGVKFADAELIGVPTILVVGRGLARGVVEVKDRVSGERTEVAVTDVTAHLTTLVGKQP